MTTPSTATLLARAAAANPAAVPLIAQLLGVGACKGCNFVHNHCRCKGETK